MSLCVMVLNISHTKDWIQRSELWLQHEAANSSVAYVVSYDTVVWKEDLDY